MKTELQPMNSLPNTSRNALVCRGQVNDCRFQNQLPIILVSDIMKIFSINLFILTKFQSEQIHVFTKTL